MDKTTRPLWPIGIFKHIPVEDEDPTATKKAIDMSYFLYNPNRETYTCRLNGKEYVKEQFLEWELKNDGVIYVMTDETKLILF